MSDTRARETAVDPERSVLVQAPAGSGKTTLLVQRFLRLLGRVDRPEEVLAITFTRKAAANMREQIVHYLTLDEEPTAPHEAAIWSDARELKARVAGWGLIENPNRLRIMTIDAFCAMLVKQMPVLSGLGKMPSLSEYPLASYREAVSRTLAGLGAGGELADDLQALLTWRDNDLQDVELLLVGLMPVREKWLRVLGVSGVPARSSLEAVLRELVEDELGMAEGLLREALAAAGENEHALAGLADFAAQVVKPESAIANCRGLSSIPDASADELARWRALAELLLTARGDARKSVTVRQGFPAKTPEKDRMVLVLEGLRVQDNGWNSALHAARLLPGVEYSDEQWRVLAAIIRVLQHCAGQLEVVFADTGVMDFSGVAAAALRGLGHADAPSDLALYLDHAISHILMDECQDSNWGQFRLLEQLTAGWIDGDGRTLFMVGDPMQSIYRFREADVGLFVQARDQGVGTVKLDFAQLTRNFRSASEIVEWVNDYIGPSFPAQDDQVMGQVCYADSVPALGAGGEVAVEVVAGRSRQQEAAVLADRIEQTLAHVGPDFQIAVLVRARTHLNELLPELRGRGIDFSSLQLDPLLERPAVQDLYALTRAIWHPADRAHWFAVLRAPWCGLKLETLMAIAHAAPKGSLWPALVDDELLADLDGGERERINRVVEVMERVYANQARLPVRDLVEGAWLRLGGRNVYADASSLRDAYKYLSVVESFDRAGRIADWAALQEALEKQRSEGSSDKAQVQVLTIHESKGLEFDMVILPGLDRPPRVPEQQLLEWLPLGGEFSENLILAPLRAAREERSTPLVNLIRRYEGEMAAAERKRLLYVAATRAKKKLIVSAAAGVSDDGPVCRHATSMLADLWPAMAGQVELCSDGGDGGAYRLPELDQALIRAPDGWEAALPTSSAWVPKWTPQDPDVDLRYDWASARVRQLGRVMHRLLELIGRDGIESLDDALLESLKGRIPLLLRQEGIGSETDIRAGTTRMVKAIENVLACPTGRWILQNHNEAACELPLTGLIGNDPVSAVIDRTFVINGERWIIDWKGGHRSGGSLKAFLEAEADRHAEQLLRYGHLFEQMEGRRTRMGIYLPMHQHWIEIESGEV